MMKDFVSSAIDDLLLGSCIVQCEQCPIVCSPLLVVRNAHGKRRLVIDLRGVNQCLPKRRFKYEGLNLVPEMFDQGSLFFHLLI